MDRRVSVHTRSRVARLKSIVTNNQPATVANDAAQRIIEMIRSGDYAPGYKMPGERQLADQLGVSRTSVRAAVGQLVAIGLLDARTGVGTFVRAPGGEAIQARLASHFFADGERLAQLFDLREIIEVEAASRVAVRATPAQIQLLRQCVERISASVAQKDREALVQADLEFHRQLVVAAGNPIIAEVMDSLQQLLRNMRYASTQTMELLPGQRALLDEIEAHNSGGARAAMRKHLATVRRKAGASISNNKHD